jgi:hypothetical protein
MALFLHNLRITLYVYNQQEAAEKVVDAANIHVRRLKHGNIFNNLTARALVPFPNLRKAKFFRNLLRNRRHLP